jgi:alanine racemase
MSDYLRCYAEISLNNIRHNIDQVKSCIPEGVRLLVVIKANAYGHGALEVAKCLEDVVDYYAVATVEEAVDLRNEGIRTPLLILGYTSPSQFEDSVKNDVTMAIYNLEEARELNRVAGAIGKKAIVHVAVDTGMTRIGFHPDEKDADAVAEISRMENINLEGMFTHFSCADQYNQDYTMMQIRAFDHMSALLEERGVRIPIRHCCNSAAIMELTDHRYDMVRSGIVTYGIYPSEEVHKERLDLRPALAWKAHVIHLQDVPMGTGVGYGATFVTERPTTRIATVSVGYADGYPRALSSTGCVLIRGKRAPILGRVCMDQMMVDVTDIPGVEIEDVVTLIGRDGEDEIPVEEVADPADSFNYEMLCRISPRVTRRYI